MVLSIRGYRQHQGKALSRWEEGSSLGLGTSMSTLEEQDSDDSSLLDFELKSTRPTRGKYSTLHDHGDSPIFHDNDLLLKLTIA